MGDSGYNFGSDGPRWNGIPMIGAFQKDFSGSTYYIDNNSGSDGNTGKSWSKAFKTLAKAVTVSNLDIARGADRWARRNTIFYAADSETATLTVLPAKCDVIGMGSCDANYMASIKGNHAPLVEHLGCRFFNVRFRPATAAIIWTLTNASNGLGFFDCQFVGSESTITATSAISTTAVEMLTVRGSSFDGAFSADVIAIGAGNASGLKILYNEIKGAANDGIVIDTGATYSNVNSKALIKGNTIHCAGCTIKDVPDTAIVVQNDLISAAATGTASLDINIRLAARNWITDATKGALYPAEH
jgi:hypothetical protein